MIIIFFPPELILTLEFKPSEKKVLKKIEDNLKEIAKPTLTKEIYQKSIKDRLSSREMNKKYTKYTELDKKVLKDSLEKGVSKIKEKALNRAIEESLFKSFIPKKINKKQENKSNIIKVSFKDQASYSKKQKSLSSNVKCSTKNSYIGIGVAFQENSSEGMNSRLDRGFWKITEVARGYVADKYDIRKGDSLLGAYDEAGYFHQGVSFIKNNKNFLNKKMKILINRNGVGIEKLVSLEKICFSLKK